MSAELKDKLELEKIENSSDTNEAVHLDDADSDESEELTKDSSHKPETQNIKRERNKNFIKTRRSSRRRAASMKKRSLSRNGFNSSLGKGNVNIISNPYRTKADKKAQNRPQGLPSKKSTETIINSNSISDDKQTEPHENKEFKTLSRGDL